MSALLTLTMALTRNFLRSRSGLFFGLIFPILLLLIFGAVFGSPGSSQYGLYVQNLDLGKDGRPTQLSSAFIKAINGSLLSVRPLAGDQDAEAFLRSAAASFSNPRVLIIPPGFQQRAMNYSALVRLRIIMDALNSTLRQQNLTQPQRQQIEQFLAQLKGLAEALPPLRPELRLLTLPGDPLAPTIGGILEVASSRFAEALLGENVTIGLTYEQVGAKTLRPMDYYLPGVVAAFIMSNGVIGVASYVSEHRRRGVLKRLSATPLSKSTWVLANALSQASISYLLFVVLSLMAWALFGTRQVAEPVGLLLVALGSLAFCGLGVLLAGLIRDVEGAVGAANAIAFPMMFLSGAFWPLEIMPAWLQALAKFLPLYYLHTGLRAALVLGDVADALPAALIMAALAAALLLAGSASIRWREA